MRQRERSRRGRKLLPIVEGMLVAALIFIPAWYTIQAMGHKANNKVDLPQREPVSFSAEDAGLVSLISRCGCEADVVEAILKPLDWDLRQSGPQVLILHTHATESYTRSEGEDYTESDSYRTLDEAYNMISIGNRLVEILEAKGIEVIHDTQVYDYPSYDDAYDIAREAVEKYLKENKTIQLVLDIHRDAVENADGSQWAPTVTVDGKTSAQVLFEIGTGCELNNNPSWRENLAVAAKLQAQLEKNWPGLCRDIDLRSSRYNQDLSLGFLLVEIGTAGNTHEEALTAAEALAEGILAISQGVNCE